MKSLRLRRPAFVLAVLLVVAPGAWAAGAASGCQVELQRMSGARGAEDALRTCSALFREPGCQTAWVEMLDSPAASPGYGRGGALARLAAGCAKAYCRLPGMGGQQLCAAATPPPLSTEFAEAWRAFQAEVLRREHVSPATGEHLAQALQRWAGFQPRPGTRSILRAVTRPDVPGVVALTLWNARAERLGAWVTDVEVDQATLLAVQAAVPRPEGASSPGVPCLRLEASPSLPPAAVNGLLHALRAVCPVDMVTLNDS